MDSATLSQDLSDAWSNLQASASAEWDSLTTYSQQQLKTLEADYNSVQTQLQNAGGAVSSELQSAYDGIRSDIQSAASQFGSAVASVQDAMRTLAIAAAIGVGIYAASKLLE